MAIDYAYRFKFEGTEYALKTFLLSEARAIQQATGKTMQEFDTALKQGDAGCLTALIWVARKRSEPTLTFDQVDGDLMTFDSLPTSTDPEPSPSGGAEGNGRVEPEQASALHSVP